MALLKFKRSAVSGKVPALTDLQLGELAINTFDGKLYMRKDNGTASIIEVGGASGVLSFNSRTGAVTLSSGDVTSALGYTPYNSSNPAGYITGINSSMVTTALGYTPANRAGDTFSGPVTINNGSHQVTLAYDGNIEITRSGGGAYIDFKDSTGEDFDARIQQSGSGFALTGLLTVSGTGLNAAIRLINNNSGSRDYRLVQKDAGYLAITDETSGAERLIINSSGNVSALVDFRAPIFYDNNNTAYYVDPASTSVINGLNVGTNAPVFSNGSFQYHQYQSPHVAYVKKTGGYNWYWRRNDTGLGGGANEVEDMSLTEGGNLLVRSDVRAPLFYDNNDTTWYVDPNGTSRVYRFKVAGETEYPGSINGDYEGGYYHFGPSDNTPNGAYGHAHIIRLNADWNVQMFFPTSNTNEPMWLRRKQNGTYSAWRRLLQEDEWIGSKYLASDGRIYATILYDANDNSCYVDPNGSSFFKGNIYNWRQGASNDCFGGLEMREADGVGNAQSAATYAPGINFHWSMRAAARIYMDASGNFVLGGQSDITNNRRSLYLSALYALNDARGTIFYDTNDTGYYADPNSTSRFVRLALGGAGAVYQGCLWAEDNVWLSGNGRKIAFTTDGSTDDGGNVSIFAWGNDFRINNWSGSALNDNFYVFGASRDAACAGNITAYYSDDRLKTKTGTIADALTKVASLEGFTYVENETARSVGYANDRQQVGVSAQAVQAVLPEAVHLAPFDYDVAEDGTITSKSGENYLTVDYSRIVPLLIEAIKELNNKVESLEAEMRSN